MKRNLLLFLIVIFMTISTIPSSAISHEKNPMILSSFSLNKVDDSVFVPTDKLNKTLAYLSLHVSWDTYGSSHLNTTKTLRCLNFKDTRTINFGGSPKSKETTNKAVTGWKKIIVDGEEKVVVAISFRGTYNRRNWEKNIIVGEGNVHQGFFDSTYDFFSGGTEKLKIFDFDNDKKAESSLSDILNNNSNKYIFWLSGHSSGGSMATIYSSYLKDINISNKNIITYTFGAPPTYKNYVPEKYNNLLVHQIINYDDIVPTITKYLGFKHCGKTYGLSLTKQPNFEENYRLLTGNNYYNSKKTVGVLSTRLKIHDTTNIFNILEIAKESNLKAHFKTAYLLTINYLSDTSQISGDALIEKNI